ncbi:MAG: hypothetical protein C5S41_10305 [Candidatus Methanomarinus sp.]|nr:MAG: hypothetical protein C5S41_10305 [ANME-2 cluster archaeon]
MKIECKGENMIAINNKLIRAVIITMALLIFLLNTSSASADNWRMSIEASSQTENVTFGIDPGATNDPDMGLDQTPKIPQAPDVSFTQMGLIDELTGTPMQTLINKDKMDWVLVVTLNKLPSTTIFWNSSGLPENLDITINDIDMKTGSSFVLIGNQSDSVVYEIHVNASIVTHPVVYLYDSSIAPERESLFQNIQNFLSQIF